MKTKQHTIGQLIQLQLKARALTEQVEALAVQCCSILGVNPDMDTNRRDDAQSVIFQWEDPEVVYEKIWGSRTPREVK